MPAIKEFLEHIAATHALLLMSNAGWHIKLPSRGRLVCQLYIDSNLYGEWSASVYDKVDGKEVWNQLIEYIDDPDDKTDVELMDDKQRDLKTFIEAWLSSTDARIRKIKYKYLFGLFSVTSTNLELYIEGQWQFAPFYESWHKYPPRSKAVAP